MSNDLFSHRRTLTGLHGTPFGRKTGADPGIEADELHNVAAPPDGPVKVTCVDYTKDKVQTTVVEDIQQFVAGHRPEWAQNGVRWIHVDGLNDMKVIQALAQKYSLHPLAIEDLLHTPQRPKVDPYPAQDNNPARLFIITRIVRMFAGPHGDHPVGQQLSLFLGHRTLLTFQECVEKAPVDLPGSAINEAQGDNLFDPIRQRLNTPGSRLRNNDASFLMYAILDTLVDNLFPILESYSDRLEELEAQILARPDQLVMRQIYLTKRQLLLLRRAAWPMREVIAILTRESQECLSEATRTYLRDVYDHIVQIIDMIETYHEFSSGLTETYMNALSNRMNEIMKVLTIFTTIFVPLTFLAGVYGMNFHYLPELDWWWSYYAFWGICMVVAGSMLIWFKRKRWL
jgi:magnesium transporter